jgi:hypothetical protein
MAFPFTPNCTFDVYRGFNAANPYAPPNIPAALISVPGYVRQHVRNGRFGVYLAPNDSNPLYWTTILNMPLGSDLRDPYNSQLVAPVIKTGDTVIMYDYPIKGTCTAFLVVFVQERSRGTPNSYLRVYLDRCRPTYGTTCPNPAGGVATQCCPSNNLPTTLFATITDTGGGCSCYAGTWTLTWTGSGWAATPPISCGSPYTLTLLTGCLDEEWFFEMYCGEFALLQLIASGTTPDYTCSPFLATYNLTTMAWGDCCTDNDDTIQVVITT